MKDHRKIALITGASQGIGLATAQLLAQEGYRVVMASRNDTALREAAQTVTGNPIVVVMDVRDDASVAQAMDRIHHHCGPVSVLINNAGIGVDGRLEDLDLALFRETMEVNYFGAIRVLKACLDDLKATRGCVVNVSSVVGYRALPHMGGYCATKFALVGLSDAIRPELAAHGIGVVDVAPGRTATDFKKNLLGVPFQRPQTVGFSETGVSPTSVAAAIAWAVPRRVPRVILTWQGKVITLLQRFSPRLTDALVNLIYARQFQHNNRPPQGETP